MEKNTTYNRGENCEKGFCTDCGSCKVISLEERRLEKNNVPQLYDKEAEHYFFYFNSVERAAK